MVKRIDNFPSLEAIAAQVAQLEDAVGRGEPAHIADEAITEVQDAVQHHVADAASRLMTGMRWRIERQEYLEAYDVYRKLLGAVALDLAHQSYDRDTDTGNVKQEVFGYLQDSKLRMVTLDYEKRLGMSSLERWKQWLAQHHKARFALPLALSGAATGALLKLSEASPSVIDLTPAQGGMVGLMTFMGGLAIRSAWRSAPRQAGTVLRNQFNASIRTYMLEEPELEAGKGTPPVLDNLPEQYAARHLIVPFGAAAIYLVNYNVKDKEDFMPMIDGLLDITEASMHESYGIDPEEGRVASYRRWAGEVLRVDIAR